MVGLGGKHGTDTLIRRLVGTLDGKARALQAPLRLGSGEPVDVGDGLAAPELCGIRSHEDDGKHGQGKRHAHDVMGREDSTASRPSGGVRSCKGIARGGAPKTGNLVLGRHARETGGLGGRLRHGPGARLGTGSGVALVLGLGGSRGHGRGRRIGILRGTNGSPGFGGRPGARIAPHHRHSSGGGVELVRGLIRAHAGLGHGKRAARALGGLARASLARAPLLHRLTAAGGKHRLLNVALVHDRPPGLTAPRAQQPPSLADK